MKKIKLGLVVLIMSFFITSCGSLMNEEIRELEEKKIFSVSGDRKTFVLNGVINSSALDEFKDLVANNPQVKQIDIVNCEGSINDDINLKLSQYIHENNFNIRLLKDGLIASGGTDLFLAGHKRTKEQNTKIGVHSWAGDNATATDFPKGHKYHLPYIKYYVSVGFTQQQAEDFYYFTINSASANDIHWMTSGEIKEYNILKQ